ncbi:beta-N-acetylhexosaminidase [Arachidicoccus soli]|uniref:beta-N-acetylhexosaminidase n=1 Tax=Arachidicoccus soli TaxID=2341117 RepID=A0A386HUN6_9BACT|nr:beta-N-acetylhexosaminidase [Arachidicoccus soli]AYD49146.1 N-acetyl-beta-hexosaminidase [Arachidicoccus soli]
MKLKLLFCYCLFLYIKTIGAQPALHIIPEPVRIQQQMGTFSFAGKIAIHFDENVNRLQKIAALMKSHFNNKDVRFRFNGNSEKNIYFKIENSATLENEEGYQLSVTTEKIIISAPNVKGIFYGLQTLFQAADENNIVPCLDISDYPQYAWRGFMLDVSRHFFTVEEIKQLLNIMAMYKMNTFHWHLCDDQGWRLQIKKYPRLTSVGAWREEIPGGIFYSKHNDTLTGKPYKYGGFYTQAEARDIVKYAAERNITVIPEIEIPGHSAAALAAYPEYSCSQKPQKVVNSIGYPQGIQCEYNPGNPATFTFLENILKEVMDIFPSEYIHIGGDEVEKTHWKNSASCQALMKREGLKNEEELQSYFINRIDKFIEKNGRKPIGWDETLEGNLLPSATVMYWRPSAKAAPLKAVSEGHPFINACADPLYFNRYQADPKTEPLAAPHSINTLEKVYNFSITPGNFSAKQIELVKGGECAIWTEFFSTASELQYMLLPRLLALSENLWTPKKEKNYLEFYKKLPAQLKSLGKKGYNFRALDKH